MWKSKKFILVAILAAVMLAGSIGGVVLAADNGDDTEPEVKYEAVLDRVLEIYEQNTGVAIDKEVLKDAFTQARSEMRTEALETWLNSLVEEGKIEQSEADAYLEWWLAKPDVSLPGPFGRFGGRVLRGGMMWGGLRGFCGPCAPAEE
jgi:hypothetical protein